MNATTRIRALFEAAETVEVPAIAPPAPPVDDISDTWGDPGDGDDPARWGEPGDAGAPSFNGEPDDPADAPDTRTPLERCVGLPLNDYGNGQRLVNHFGEDMLFVPRVGWFGWTGQVWQKDPDELTVRRNAQAIAARVLDEIPLMGHEGWEQDVIATRDDVRRERGEISSVPKPDRTPEQCDRLDELDEQLRRIAAVQESLGKRRNDVKGHAKASGNSPKIGAMVLESTTMLSRPLELLDADPLIVNCASGALRFSVDKGEGYSTIARVDLLPHSRDQLLTKMIGADWRIGAGCPKFEAFLTQIQPDPEIRGLLQRWFGLSLTGLLEQKLVFMHGGGANGKSVLVELLARILGDYAASVRIEALTGTHRRGGSDATPELIPLVGARMVRASEPEEGERLQEGKVKELTGGEPMMVRALNNDFFKFTPLFKLTISGNHKPDIRGGDDGIWRRVLLVPFIVQIPKEARRDFNELVGDLFSERDGILQWMADGLIDYLESGLQVPKGITGATDEYRDESDPMGKFLVDCCVITGDSTDTILTADLVQAFQYWQIEQAYNKWTPNTIQKRLSTKAANWRHPGSLLTITKGKSSLSRYEGLQLTETFKRRVNQAPKGADGSPLRAADMETYP